MISSRRRRDAPSGSSMNFEPVRLMTPQIAAAPIYLFPPEPALRVEGGGRPAPDEGSNPPEGAVIYYSFARAPSGPVTLEILDSSGSVLRRFSSETKVEKKAQLVKGAEGEPPAPPLSKQAGLNRYVWNCVRRRWWRRRTDSLRAQPAVPRRPGHLQGAADRQWQVRGTGVQGASAAEFSRRCPRRSGTSSRRCRAGSMTS